VAKVENTITSSVVKHPYVLNKSTLIEDVVEDVDDKRLFAVVKFMGKQYKLTKVRSRSCNFLFILLM